MSAMTDFARMPTRQKVMVFAVIGLVLGLLYYQFVYKGLKADLETAENEQAAKIANNQRLEADIPKFADLQARYPRIKAENEENQKALPSEAELPAFFETLNRKVLESGVEVVRSRALPEEKVDRFVRVPVEYEIVGTYNQIKKFFASLVKKPKEPGDTGSTADGEVEEQERIVSVENLSLTNPTVRNREIVLTGRFIASTYRMEDGSAPPAAKKAAAPAKPATPPATTPPATTPPAAMPPAATPAGAKARTDNAMDKNEERNEKAGAAGEAGMTAGSAKPGTPAAGVERLKGGI
jgi:Tfp pilus assembly protein PilO